jgi:hypothetical protein
VTRPAPRATAVDGEILELITASLLHSGTAGDSIIAESVIRRVVLGNPQATVAGLTTLVLDLVRVIADVRGEPPVRTWRRYTLATATRALHDNAPPPC